MDVISVTSCIPESTFSRHKLPSTKAYFFILGNGELVIDFCQLLTTHETLSVVSTSLQNGASFLPLGAMHPIYRTDVPLLPRVRFLYI